MKKKAVKPYIVLAVICLLLAVAGAISSFFVKDKRENINLFIILSLSFLALMVVFIIIYLVVRKANYKIVEQDEKNIVSALENYQKSKTQFINIQSDDEGIKEVANKVNDIVSNDVVLEYSHLYEGEHFFTLIKKHMIKTGLEKFAYIRLVGMKEKVVNTIVDKYPYCYIGEKDGVYDIVLTVFDKRELEQYLTVMAFVGKDRHVLIAYYDEYSLDEIEGILKGEEYLQKEILIMDRNIEKEVFNNVINKYRQMDLAKKDILADMMIDIFPYLPFSHMGVLIDETYIEVVTYEGKQQMHVMQDKEFKSFLKLSGITYKGHQINMAFAHDSNDIVVTPQLLYNLNKVLAIVNSLGVAYLNNEEIIETNKRYDKLEEIHHALSYEVNDDYKVINASKKLNERYNDKLIGSYCYETLFGLEEPCKNCPLKKGENKTYMMVSNSYNRKVDIDGDKRTIYLLNEKKPYVADKEELRNKLLGLLNANGRGYILVFKIDSLPQLAARNKIEVEDVVKNIIEVLDIYGLTNNLYRKESDEFAYILENASVSEAILLSKSVSTAFLETFEVEDKEFNFLPKVILLSYPLEVNTLFSLDSLCRTLFKNVTKKGALYRIDEKPLSIDDHRYYMEIVESSYKEGVIPFTYTKVKDVQNKNKYMYAELNYVDENQNRIPEDQITLYTKIDKTYLTLVEKVVRGLNYEDKEVTYLLPLGKEGIDKKLFSSLQGYFKSVKVDPSRVIFEIKEKDVANNMEVMKEIMKMGFKFSVNINDNYDYNLDLPVFEYIRINGSKLDSIKAYQIKVNNLMSKGANILIEDKYKELVVGSRYTF